MLHILSYFDTHLYQRQTSCINKNPKSVRALNNFGLNSFIAQMALLALLNQ